MRPSPATVPPKNRPGRSASRTATRGGGGWGVGGERHWKRIRTFSDYSVALNDLRAPEGRGGQDVKRMRRIWRRQHHQVSQRQIGGPAEIDVAGRLFQRRRQR